MSLRQHEALREGEKEGRTKTTGTRAAVNSTTQAKDHLFVLYPNAA